MTETSLPDPNPFTAAIPVADNPFTAAVPPLTSPETLSPATVLPDGGGTNSVGDFVKGFIEGYIEGATDDGGIPTNASSESVLSETIPTEYNPFSEPVPDAENPFADSMQTTDSPFSLPDADYGFDGSEIAESVDIDGGGDVVSSVFGFIGSFFE
jgi:hypothetical protein